MMKKISEKLMNDMETAKRQTLSDEELSLVKGGRDDTDFWCLFGYCCFTAFLHPGDAHGDDSCLWDYLCLKFHN